MPRAASRPSHSARSSTAQRADARPAGPRTSGRRLRYQVAASLDGFIAGPNGEADWIPMDPDIDFGALFAQFDTLLMGRRTYEGLAAHGDAGGKAFGLTTIVASRTLAKRVGGPRVLGDDLAAEVAALKAAPGKDVWLFGGGNLFRSLLALGLVDRVEVALVPVLLGAGVPLFPSPAATTRLRLTGQRVYPKTGVVSLEYDVVTQ